MARRLEILEMEKQQRNKLKRSRKKQLKINDEIKARLKTIQKHLLTFIIEEPHEQEIIQLYSLIEKIDTGIQPEGRKLKSQASFVRQKRVRQRLALTSKFVLIEKCLAAKPQKIEEEVQLQIKKYQHQVDKMEIERKMQTQQKLYFKPLIKRCYCRQRLDIYGGNICSEKECLSSIEKNLEHRGDYIVTALEVSTERSQQQSIRMWLYSNRILIINSSKINSFKKTTMTLEFIQRSWRKITRR